MLTYPQQGLVAFNRGQFHWKCLRSLSLIWVWKWLVSWLYLCLQGAIELTHWRRETHICIPKLTIIGSDNGLSPGGHQAIIWTSARILLIGPLRTNVSEIFIGNYTFSFKKMHFKMSSAKWRPLGLGLDVLESHMKQGTQMNKAERRSHCLIYYQWKCWRLSIWHLSTHSFMV